MIRLESQLGSRQHAICTLVLLSWVLLAGSAPASEINQRDKFLKSAVRIRYDRPDGTAVITGHGTAFFVDLSTYGYAGSKYLLSVAHNVLDEKGVPYESLKIEYEIDSKLVWSKCRVVAFDKKLDVCLIESRDSAPEIAKLADADAADEGAAVVLAGSPRGIPIKLFDGTLAKQFDSVPVRLSARIPFDHGDSGGPFFSPQSGKVIGVAVAGIPKDDDLDHNVGLFVPISSVRGFLEKNRAGDAHPAHAQTPKLFKEEEKRLANTRPEATIKSAAESRVAAVKANTLPIVEIEKEVETASLQMPKPIVSGAHPAIYVVHEGENLTQIANRFNIPIEELSALNNIRNPSALAAGAKLLLP